MAELVREVHIKARPEEIFEYLVDPAKYALWGGNDVVLDPRPGGTYRAVLGGTHHSAGEFVEVVPNERVVFSFGWDEPDHPTVRLTHSGLPEDAVSDHMGGWDHYLERLEIVATGGDAGPDGPSAPDSVG